MCTLSWTSCVSCGFMCSPHVSGWVQSWFSLVSHCTLVWVPHFLVHCLHLCGFLAPGSLLEFLFPVPCSFLSLYIPAPLCASCAFWLWHPSTTQSWLLRMTTTIIREGGERSEGPDAQCNGNTRFILYTKQNTRHQNGKLNWGAKGTNWGPTTLVGYPQHHVHM